VTSPTPSSFLRLLQLSSPTLPIGAFAYSQGLEAAVESQVVTDEASLGHWTSEQLEFSLGRVDLPMLWRLVDAVARGQHEREFELAARLVAMRETRELREDDLQRGRALMELLGALGGASTSHRAPGEWAAWPFARATAHAIRAWKLPVREALSAYAWSSIENQIVAGVKLIPLGQVAGQRLLLAFADRIPEICDASIALEDDEIGGTLPMVAVLSSQHETQYSRLFRS
jgi:urease accessory protein